MSVFPLFVTLIFAASSIFAAQIDMEVKGVVKAASDGKPVENAIAQLKMNDSLMAYARTLSDNNGNFKLGSSSLVPVVKHPSVMEEKFESYSVLDLRGRAHSVNNLPQGVYVLIGKTEAGKNISLGIVYHKGGALAVKALNRNTKSASLSKPITQSAAGAGDEIWLIIRKTGYLPKKISLNSFKEDAGAILLERDPLEERIDSVLNLMNLSDKIHQMNQTLCTSYGAQVNCTFGNGANLSGSVLQGGEGYSASILSNAYSEMLKTTYNVKIPVTYGKDMMHGAAVISGATIFPHNIGMGATRDSALVRRACEVTAKESWAGNVDLIFGPAIPVPQDERWGRVYEGFGETAELAVMMGAACVRGYQGDKYNAPWRVIATAKHYLGDGATDNGKDRGNSTATDETLRALHLPGYEAVVEQGVLSIMASFNQIRGTHQHIDSLRLTGWLKTELGFDGYVIADWAGISNSMTPGFTDACDYGSCSNSEVKNIKDAVRKSVNAGLDMAMNEPDFVTHLTALVDEGSVSKARIDDAVRRILRAKFRAGRMDNPNPNDVNNLYKGTIGNASYRAVAREAVSKSMVLLKNDNGALPISKSAKVYVFGSHANNTGRQCGGWTNVGSDGWQGGSGTVQGATSIQAGIDLVAPDARVTLASQASVIIYVTGEEPYAEWKGDISDIAFNDATNAAQLNTYKSEGKKVVTVFMSGRARETNALLNSSDAFVAAWLPGSEGAGVADVLFGDKQFTGKLPHTWPRNKAVFPKNSIEPSDDWFPYGFGLSN